MKLTKYKVGTICCCLNWFVFNDASTAAAKVCVIVLFWYLCVCVFVCIR